MLEVDIEVMILSGRVRGDSEVVGDCGKEYKLLVKGGG